MTFPWHLHACHLQWWFPKTSEWSHLGIFSKQRLFAGWWLSLPLWKIWVRQLGWWHSQLIWKNKSHVPKHQMPSNPTKPPLNHHFPLEKYDFLGPNFTLGPASDPPLAVSYRWRWEGPSAPHRIQSLHVDSTTFDDVGSKYPKTQMIHVWYIYLHLGHLWGTCR